MVSHYFSGSSGQSTTSVAGYRCEGLAQGFGGVRDIEVDEREAPIRAATVRERSPAARLANAPDPEGTPVAALLRSAWYARIFSIGGRLGESPHFHVAHPPPPRQLLLNGCCA